MVRRRRGASFMASAYVFPGGGLDAAETEAEAAARELFEEAGVALVRGEASAEQLEALRRRMLANQAPAKELLAAEGLEWDVEALVPWAHWITPSVEPKRFSAKFFAAALPPGQSASIDEVEAVELAWVDVERAAERAAELALPPPQLRTLWELRGVASVAAALEAARARSTEPILPRGMLAPSQGGAPPVPCLLLPWDPEYLTLGQGDALPMSVLPSWAHGPSRFLLEPSGDRRAWRHVYAPGSTPPAS